MSPLCEMGNQALYVRFALWHRRKAPGITLSLWICTRRERGRLCTYAFYTITVLVKLSINHQVLWALLAKIHPKFVHILGLPPPLLSSKLPSSFTWILPSLCE